MTLADIVPSRADDLGLTTMCQGLLQSIDSGPPRTNPDPEHFCVQCNAARWPHAWSRCVGGTVDGEHTRATWAHHEPTVRGPAAAAGVPQEIRVKEFGNIVVPKN